VLASDGGERGLGAIAAWVGAAMDADLVAVEDQVADGVGSEGGRGHAVKYRRRGLWRFARTRRQATLFSARPLALHR